MTQSDPWLLGAALTLVRRRRWVVAVPLATAVLAVAYGYVSREYVSESRFLPRSGAADVSRLSGLAAQFGFNFGAGQSAQSPQVYLDLLKARDLLLAAAQTDYSYLLPGARDSVRGTLVGLLHLRARTPEGLDRAAINALRGRVVVATDPGSGVVELKVVAPSGQLAEAVNRRLLELVNEFNLRQRQSQAAAEREFTQQRMQAAQLGLDSAEDDLRRFTERNRIIEDPALRLEQSRLQRRIELRQQLYLTLAQAFEQARLEEFRNTPVITVLDGPEHSAEPSVSLKLSFILGLFLGFFLALALVLATEFASLQRKEHPATFAGLEAEVRRVPTVGFLVRAWGAVRRAPAWRGRP